MNLKENVNYYHNDSKTVIEYGTKEYIITDPYRKFFNMLKDKKYDKYLQEFLFSKNLINQLPNISSENRNKHYFSCRTLSSISDWKTIQYKLNNITFVIIGCGGIGTVVVDNLIRLGFKNFILIDGDNVERSNFNRQVLYTTDDIGIPKVNALSKEAQKITLNRLNIRAYYTFINSENDLSKILDDLSHDRLFIIDCADKPLNLINIIGEYSKQYKIPFTLGYVGIESGTWGPVFDKNNPFISKSTAEWKTIFGSIPTTNMIIGALLSHTILDYIFKDIFIDTSSAAEHILNFSKLEIQDD